MACFRPKFPKGCEAGIFGGGERMYRSLSPLLVFSRCCFVLFLSFFLWSSQSVPAQPAYELHGIIQDERYVESLRSNVTNTGSFSVYVNDCGWLIRGDIPHLDRTTGVREIGSTNGTEIFEVSLLIMPQFAPQESSEAKSDSAADPSPAQAQPISTRQGFQAFVKPGPMPASCSPSDGRFAHLWLMFASRCFFAGREDSEILAAYDINSCVTRGNDYTMEGAWVLSTAQPGLPLSLAYINRRGHPFARDAEGNRTFVPFDPPFDAGFTNALYTVTGTTNVGRLVLPTGFIFERFRPGWTNRQPAPVLEARSVATVTNFMPHCSRTSLVPELPPRVVVIDMRELPADPSKKPIHYSGAAGQWLPVEEAKRVHEARLRRHAPRELRPLHYVLFVVALVLPLGGIALWKRKGAGEN
jgi:hypothetical protein